VSTVNTVQAVRSRQIRQRAVLLAIASVFIFSLAVASEQPAYGYVDPGSGLLLTQIIVFSLRRRVVLLFRSGDSQNRESPGLAAVMYARQQRASRHAALAETAHRQPRAWRRSGPS
jgi:hypothetical protein